MSGSQTFLPLSREALEEHDQILFHLERLEAALDQLEPDALRAETFEEISVRIDSLRERIEEHFRHEDSGGLFQGLIDNLPDAEDQIHDLVAEHDRLMAALEMVSIRSRQGDPSQAGVLRGEIETLIRDIREHEGREAALLKLAIGRSDPQLR